MILDAGAYVSPDYSIADDVRIGANAQLTGCGTIGPGVVIGSGAILDGELDLGARCIIGPNVYFTGRVRAGDDNEFGHGATIGAGPEHAEHRHSDGWVVIGSRNVFREHCMITMPTTSPLTTIGNENYLMHRSYVAHDCLIGDHVKFAMVVSIGGHSIIGDYAYVGMHVGVHQRTSIGIHAMVGMGSAIVKNVPPYATIVCGRFTKINGYGLRLRAFTDDQIAAIESEYGFRDAPPVKGMDDVLGPIRDFRKIEGKTYEPCSS